MIKIKDNDPNTAFLMTKTATFKVTIINASVKVELVGLHSIGIIPTGGNSIILRDEI